MSAESDEYAVGLALGVERILDDATGLTADEMVETRDNLLALFYSHLDDLRTASRRAVCSPEGAHPFEASYSGMVCDRMVLRDGYGDQCGLPNEHPVHRHDRLEGGQP